MGILDMCCPKKPKKSLDYIIKWVEDADKTIKYLSDSIEAIKEMDLQKVFDDYARDEYDWSQVPEFDAKADKVENATEGNFASLDSNGNLQDSDYDYSSFAPFTHSHSEIKDIVEGHQYAKVYVDNQTQGDPNVIVELTNYNAPGGSTVTKSAIIGIDNIDNLSRALGNPDDTPTEDSQKLITSGGVKAALDNKQDTLTFDSTPTTGSTNPVTSGGVKTALDGKMSNAIAEIRIVRNGSSLPLNTEDSVTDSLDEFIDEHAENEAAVCTVRMDNGVGYGYATGVAHWEFKPFNNMILVYVRIGVLEFIAKGQTQTAGRVDGWMNAWVFADYSQDFDNL